VLRAKFLHLGLKGRLKRAGRAVNFGIIILKHEQSELLLLFVASGKASTAYGRCLAEFDYEPQGPVASYKFP
jgi:hypothetical protein